MATSGPATWARLWAAAYLGCLALVLVDLTIGGRLSGWLLVELAWLGLLGSLPVALLLGGAERAAEARPGVVIATTLIVAAACAGLGWEQADLLLSGPRWAIHEHRGSLRAVVAAGAGWAGAAGWLWLRAGAGAMSRRWTSMWWAIGALTLTGILSAITRHRAYDGAMAQLLLPGATVLAAWMRRLTRAGGAPVVAIAGACAALALGSRVSDDWISRGQREVSAHSRAGSLASLYVLPRWAAEPVSNDGETNCARVEPIFDPAPVAIDPDRRRNVIVVSVDALRRDVVGAVEHGTPITPGLADLSRKSVSFRHATSTYPATLFAVGSAFTGLSPGELYLHPGMPETIFTRSRGHVDRQLVVLPDVSWFRIPVVTEFLSPGAEIALSPDDAASTTMLVERLRSARRANASVMAWIHYYAPHAPYRARSGLGLGKGKRAAYLSEVAYFDRQLTALFDYLVQDGWLEDSLVVFFSDHGEALGEDGYYGHHVYLDGWMVDVPLMLWHADLPASEPWVGVSVSDIAPTVLHFLGLPRPSDLVARSLLSIDHEWRDRATFSEAFPVRGKALFESFPLPSLDAESIRSRIDSIRRANEGYEPKGSVTLDGARLIHHRSSGAKLISGPQSSAGSETAERLTAELARWEAGQLQRILCRLRINELERESPRPR